MKILIISPDNVSGVEYHRLLMPHLNMGKKGHSVSATTSIDHQPIEFFQDYDIIIASRSLSKMENHSGLWAIVKKSGIPIIIDTDDQWQLSHDHIQKKYWVANDRAAKIINNFKQADAITCTTPYLRELCLNFNPNVKVLPNGIDFNQPQFQPDDKISQLKDERINIGWSGGATHYQDLGILADCFMSMRSNPDWKNKYRLLLSGFVDKDPTWNAYEKIFTSNYKIDEDHYSRINVMDVNSYASALELFDIGLVPLRDTPFNRAKSELKMLELGAKKVASIVSDVYPYTLLAKHKVNCLMSDKRGWFNSIKLLMDSSQMRIDLGETLYEHIFTNYNLEKMEDERIEFYQSLINRK